MIAKVGNLEKSIEEMNDEAEDMDRGTMASKVVEGQIEN